MSKTFHTYIRKYQVIRPERLYGQFRGYTESAFTSDEASIYFIVKCMAAQWLPETFAVNEDYRLNGHLRVDGTVHEVTLDMSAFWFAMPQMQEHFPDKEHMAQYFMARSKAAADSAATGSIKYRHGSSIDLVASDGDKLVIECELCRNMSREGRARTEIHLYQAINFFGLPAPRLDIVYIGSSVSNTFKRLLKHDKWGRIQAEKKRDEDILVYFAELDGDMFQRAAPEGFSLIARDDHGIGAKDETLITEMALINYFKPHYNVLHKERDISHSGRIEQVLKTAGFNEVAVELILDGSLGTLGTPAVGIYGSHTAIHGIT